MQEDRFCICGQEVFREYGISAKGISNCRAFAERLGGL